MSSDMVIVFQHGDEAPQAFPLGKPGGNISLAWGLTRRAAIWKVVASPNGDVYVMERKTGSCLKASLHQSKVWRYAWVEPAVALSPMVQSFVEMTGDRIIDRWDRPQALAGGTLTIGYTIFTTGEDIRAAKDDPAVTSKVGWLPPPAVGERSCPSTGVNDDGRRFPSKPRKLTKEDPRPCPVEYLPPIGSAPRSTPCSLRSVTWSRCWKMSPVLAPGCSSRSPWRPR